MLTQPAVRVPRDTLVRVPDSYLRVHDALSVEGSRYDNGGLGDPRHFGDDCGARGRGNMLEHI